MSSLEISGEDGGKEWGETLKGGGRVELPEVDNVTQKQLNILHNELTPTKIQYETLKKAKDARKKPLVTCKRSPVRLSDLSSGILEFQRQ